MCGCKITKIKKKKFDVRAISNLPITFVVVPPGAPTVDKHGPLFPALETNTRLCFVIASSMAVHTLLKSQNS